MSSTEQEVTFRKFDHRVTLNVKIHVSQEFRARKWAAMRLIRLAAWVLGCGIKVETEDAG